MLSGDQLRAREEELEKLEVLAEQMHARMDELRAEIARAKGLLVDDPSWEQELTPVKRTRWITK